MQAFFRFFSISQKLPRTEARRAFIDKPIAYLHHLSSPENSLMCIHFSNPPLVFLTGFT